MHPNDNFICPSCHLGHLDLKLTTYVRQYGETMICVPNTPGWTCDVCHFCQFDPSAVQRIEVLIGQAGPPPNRYQPPNRAIKRPEKRAEQQPKAAPAKARQKAK